MTATSQVKAPVGSIRPGDLVETEKLAVSCSSVQHLPGGDAQRLADCLQLLVMASEGCRCYNTLGSQLCCISRARELLRAHRKQFTGAMQRAALLTG